MCAIAPLPRARVLVRTIQPVLDDPDRDLGAAAKPELPQNALDVVGDGARREGQSPADLRVGQPPSNQDDNDLLSLGESRAIPRTVAASS